MLASGSPGENGVLQEVVQPARDPGGAGLFGVQGGIAELAAGGAAGVRFRHPVRHEGLGHHLQMRLHFFAQEPRAGLALEPVAEPPQGTPQHHAIPMTRAMAPVIWRYRAVSAARVFRPPGVSL
jgi:hypothetical protein